MNWPKSRSICNVLAILCTVTALGCGVKGDPLPPERPPQMGRGRPTYQKAAEKLKIETKKDVDDEEKH